MTNPVAHADGMMRSKRQSRLNRRRVQLLISMLLTAILPFALRYPFVKSAYLPLEINSLLGNLSAVMIAFWARLSVEPYPGIRSTYVILPSAAAAYGAVVAFFVLTRLPYDRLGLVLGFGMHMIVGYALYFAVQRRTQLTLGIVPHGDVEHLKEVEGAQWLTIPRPRLEAQLGCDAIVADLASDLPDEWERFLADVSLAGTPVYQVKHIRESLTGRVEIDRLSENSFGLLVPAKGYFHLKELLDWLFAAAMLPFALPLMLGAAIAIRIEGSGPVFFRQTRIGHAGDPFKVFKFRTMNVSVPEDDARKAAMTVDFDPRVTRVGAFLRRTRIDEVPQILNILRGEMSWIGPRPEAAVLSSWYLNEIPFYRYRHVVKPGISGWAQVNQGHVAEVDEVHRKLQYDFYYIKYFSPWLDVLILFKTIKTMLFGFGAR